jgi:hypothetical protein
LICNLSTYFIDVVTTARKVEQGLMKLGKVRNSLVKFDVMSNDELEGGFQMENIDQNHSIPQHHI